jgi:hypothetical protein
MILVASIVSIRQQNTTKLNADVTSAIQWSGGIKERNRTNPVQPSEVCAMRIVMFIGICRS